MALQTASANDVCGRVGTEKAKQAYATGLQRVGSRAACGVSG
jgi:hypothetical protein